MSDIQRLMPHSEEAEKGLLCSFLHSPKEVGSICVGEGLTPEMFYFPGHEILYRRLHKMWSENRPVEFFLLQDALRDAGELDQIGGRGVLMDIKCFIPSAAMVGEYLEIVRDKHVLRMIIVNSTAAIEAAYSSGCAADTLLQAQEGILQIATPKKEKRKSLKALLIDAVNRIQSGQNLGSDIKSGIYELDKVVRMRRGNSIVIGGQTKSGKTALLGNIITNSAIRMEKRCLLFSLEMSTEEQVDRFISSEGSINISMLGSSPTQDEMNRLFKAVTRLDKADIEIVTDARTLPQLIATARQLHAVKPLDLIALDYFQLVESGSARKSDTREMEVASISRQFKRLCVELNCVGIGLSQLNDQGRLRESRAIGQDANSILEVAINEEGERKINIIAQRSGEAGRSIAVTWLPQFTRFEDAITN